MLMGLAPLQDLYGILLQKANSQQLCILTAIMIFGKFPFSANT